MKFSDLQNKGISELQELLKEMRVKLGKLKFELAANTLKDSSQIRKVKKDIAQIMTALQKLAPGPARGQGRLANGIKNGKQK